MHILYCEKEKCDKTNERFYIVFTYLQLLYFCEITEPFINKFETILHNCKYVIYV